MRWMLLLGLLTGSCARSVYMRPAAGPARVCNADAYVVFVRPGRGGSLVEIREADGSFLGQIGNESWFGTPVAPGEHFFVARTDRRGSLPVALKATLGAGRTYYVDVEVANGYPGLFATSPRLSYWRELGGWLARTDRLERNPASYPGLVEEQWQATYSAAAQGWRTLDGDRSAERTLIASDGSVEPAPKVRASAESCSRRAARPGPPPAVVDVSPRYAMDVPACTTEPETGSHVRTRTCRSDRQGDADRDGAWRYMELPRVIPNVMP